MGVLSEADVERFVHDGMVRVDEAVPRELAEHCRDLLWAETGVERHDRSTWTRPVIRLGGRSDDPFQRAAKTPRLHAAFDQIVGPGRWRPRNGLGTFPIRFPHPDDPGDAGWHVDASYLPEGAQRYHLNLHSHGRALLLLFLFSEVGPDDAPTRIRVGSHRMVASLLAPHGDRGAEFFDFATHLGPTASLPVALATGSPGDVYLCHPFLVHAAQRHRGREPRFIAQPELQLAEEGLRLEGTDPTPVERAVLLGLRGSRE